jgi:4-hydroxybenzoyl-CoA thioesterase/acyl-CoA thioester hydrolase
MSGPFRTSRLVEFHDTDMAGIMHFASFFHYMESAEHEMIRSLGLSVHPQGSDEVISFPRVHASCDFQSPARCEEMLDIEIRIERIGTKSITYHFELGVDGRPIASGKMVCVCCLISLGKSPESIAIPDEIRKKLQQYA